MPWRSQQSRDTVVDTLVYIGPAALAAIADHIWGLVDVLVVAVAILWFLFMTSGYLKAAIKAGRRGGVKCMSRAFDERKAIEGLGYGAAIAISFAVLGLLEAVQIHTSTILSPEGGAHIPLVAPVLGFALVWFAVEIAGHVAELHEDLGRWISSAVDRARGQVGGAEDDRDE